MGIDRPRGNLLAGGPKLCFFPWYLVPSDLRNEAPFAQPSKREQGGSGASLGGGGRRDIRVLLAWRA